MASGLQACQTTATAKGDAPPRATPAREFQARYRDLGAALRQLPNVQVAGRSVTYRGVSTMSGDAEMRFAIDGDIVGVYDQVEPLVPLDEIRDLVLLPPLEASQKYGMLGSAGVIDIRTAKVE